MDNELSRVVDALPGLVWTALPGGHVDFVNRRWSDYTGLGTDEARGEGWLAMIHPEDLHGLLERWRSILASGEPGEMEARLRHFDGTYRWFRIAANPARDEAGKVVKWYAINTDIDDGRKAEAALRQRELGFRLIVDSIPIPVAVTTPSGEVEGLNQPTLDYFGKTFEELKGWKASEVVHPDDLEQTIAAQLEAHRKGSAYNVESRHRRADGVYRWYNVHGMPLRDPQGNILRWLHLLIDIDDRKRAEEAVRDSERRARAIVDGIPGFVAILTPDGKTDVVNRQMAEYHGLTDEELRKWATNRTIHDDDLPGVTEIFNRAIASSTPYEIEYRLRRFDGVYRWFYSRGVPLRDFSGRIGCWYALQTDIDEKKRAEEALAASQRNLQLIIDTMPALAWSARPDGSAEFLSKHYVDYIGLPPEQVPGWGYTVALHPDDRDRLDATWQNIVASGMAGEAEARLRRHDGVYRWFLFRANPLRDDNGNIIKWYGVSTDIDDRKRAEEALRESERQSRQVVNSIPGMVAVFGPRGEVEGLNRQFLGYLGQTQEEFANWATNGTVHPDDLLRHIETLKRSLDSGFPIDFETRLRRFDGVYRWFQLRGDAARDTAANIVRWYCLMTDVDERKRAEEELRRSEAFLAEGQRLSLTGTFSWLVVADEIIWSEQIYRIFEFDPSLPVTLELIGSRVHPDDMPLMFDMVERARGDRGDFEYDHRIQMPDGSIKYLHLLAHATRNKNGRLEYIGAVQDVTERRLADEALGKLRSELAHVARVSSLGALTASIAHEVNQPLSGIITNAGTCLRMLAADPPNVEGARETARRTIRDGNRAADVITRLRELFSKRTASIEPVDINETAQEVISLASGDLRRSRVVLRTEFDNELPPVAGDRVQLQQVILNLLRNASDAMSGVEDRPRQLVIRTQPDQADHVRLSVQDAGVGFDPQSADRLFEAFYTTKDDGMGMGLSVSRSIIEGHRGRLWAAPNDGPGATFAFSIPCEPERATGGQRLGAIHTPPRTDAQHIIGNP